ncbi:MAG: aquaporin [Bacteroidota bacterium]
MIKAFKQHWPEYLMEAWGLGLFMVSAALFTILLEHPSLGFPELIPSPFARRWVIGLAMGLTAIYIMYSPWGKRSGAHLNPAVSITFWKLGKIKREDMIFYIISQFIGGYIGIVIFKILAYAYISAPSVRYAVTVPGALGWTGAFVLEALLSFILMFVVLLSSNDRRIAAYTPIWAGILLTFFIALEAPYSGMSINPARTVASALPAQVWVGWWIYFLAPPLGMLLASEVYGWMVGTRLFKCYLSPDPEQRSVHCCPLVKAEKQNSA